MRPELEVEAEDLALPAGHSKRQLVRILRPMCALAPAPVVLYLPGSATSDDELHDRLVRELALGTQAAVLIPAPERGPAPHPDQLEQAYEILCWTAWDGRRRGLDGARVALAGDGTGAALAAALVMTSEQRGGPHVRGATLLRSRTNGRAALPAAAGFLAAALRTGP